MRIAILTPSSGLLSATTAAALALAGLEVIDFYWDGSTETINTAAAFLLIAEESLGENTDLEQSLVRFLKEQNVHGKPIFGLGYGGAKLLVDSGLVPGIYKNLPALVLSQPEKETGLQEEAWIRLAENYQYNAFTQKVLPQQLLPVKRRNRAQFILPPGLLAEMQAQGQLVFFYCDAEGRQLPGNAIAGISSKSGTVMALLPYPETGEALLFQSLRSHLESGFREQVEPLAYWPRK